MTNVWPLVKAAPPISTADTNVMMTAIVDVFMYFCARNGLTSTKNLSHDMTVDRNCDTHIAPLMPGNKTRLIIHGINRLIMDPHLMRVRDLGPLEYIYIYMKTFHKLKNNMKINLVVLDLNL